MELVVTEPFILSAVTGGDGVEGAMLSSALTATINAERLADFCHLLTVV